jgi:hypothetical protein
LAYTRRFEKAQPLETDELKEILTTQIYGIELSEEAAKITAFSLYLALLELQSDLNTSEDFRFPHLLNLTIFNVDTFNQDAPFNNFPVFKEKRFNLIMGNPPWTSWRGPETLGEKYCKSKKLPIADRKPYQAFIWRTKDFASKETEIALLVHAGMFFLQKAGKFRQQFLNDCSLRAIVNLSDLRKLKIFQTVAAPAAVLFFRMNAASDRQDITYCCPKWTSSTKATREIILNSDDVVSLPLSAPLKSEIIWKTAFWGTARDYALIQRLQRFCSLGEFLQNEGFKSSQIGKTGYTIGNRRENTPLELLGLPHLEEKMHSYRLPSQLPGFALPKLERPRKVEIYRGPLVIVNKGIQENSLLAAFSNSDVVYSQDFYGFVISSKPQLYGHYLSAILNSKIVTYFQFTTCSSWGIERDAITRHEILRTPIPPLSKVTEAFLKESQWLYENIDKATDPQIVEHQSVLDGLIYELYGLTTSERELVEDTLGLTVDFFQNRDKSVALQPPSVEELKEFAQASIDVLNAYLTSIGKQYNAVVFETAASPLRMVKLTYDRAKSEADEVRIQTINRLDTVLRELSENLRTEIADNLAVRRSLRIYQGTDIYLLQPAERRYWSRSAGRNEANRILKEQLERV